MTRRNAPVRLDCHWAFGDAAPEGAYDIRVCKWTCTREPKAVRFTTRDGDTTFVATRNMDDRRDRYAWRLTRFDTSVAPGGGRGMEPIGHSYGHDCSQALRLGLEGWGRVRLRDWVE